ncbi:MAG: esterase-like activity of phytase family protein, partial [Candidatus Marinimicrobia bacterium]|nr:esterase-like activity of phytase family protein [Candidatus Neomarinimicrobiota bacterium]
SGYAFLPAETFRAGPPCTNEDSGRLKHPADRWDSQPVQGVSSLRPAPDDTFWALSDNGFGTRSNSSTYLLCLYRLKIDWLTVNGGSGSVTVIETIELSDPHDLAGFRITRNRENERRLTGADFDPESLELGEDGTFWIGDERGPWLLHLSPTGALLEPPIHALLESGGKRRILRSPDHPHGKFFWLVNHDRSRGFEGLAFHAPTGVYYLLLEGTLRNERSSWLQAFAYRPGLSNATAHGWRYRMESRDHSAGELTYWREQDVFLVVERDQGHGSQARFKKIYAWQPQVDSAAKREVADLMNVGDPDHLAGESGSYRMPYVTIESVLPLDSRTIMVCNDNNFPMTGGRTAQEKDGTEFALLRVVIAGERH